MMSSTGNRHGIIVIIIAALVAAGAIVAVLLTSRPMPSDMPGMDHTSPAVLLTAGSMRHRDRARRRARETTRTARMALP